LKLSEVKVMTFKKPDGETATRWVECGVGNIHLNVSRSNETQSRILARNIGSKNLIFNFRIWEKFTVEKLNDRNVRIVGVAVEEGKPAPKIFALRFPKDVNVPDFIGKIEDLKKKSSKPKEE
jgi:hypothetical protein